MRISKQTKDKIRALPIISVAEHLGMELYGMGELNRRSLCPFHDDHDPSLHLNATKNIFKCFSCGKGGDVIGLVMQVENLKYLDACQWLINEFNVIVVEESRKQGTTETRKQESVAPSIPKSVIPLNQELVAKSLSVDSLFCKSVISTGYLSEGQLRHAAARYHLGVSKDGGVIFWQIDEQQRIRTGKVMYYQPGCHRIKERKPTWVHTLLKRQLPKNYELHRCLFGQHLLMEDVRGKKEDKKSVDSSFRSSGNPLPAVCVVESEKTAVICSEHFPSVLWLACGGLQMFSAEMLQPLTDYKVVIFPDTDTTGETYSQWHAIAQEAQKRYSFKYPIRISHLLEDHASLDQKQRKIDIVDFLFETDSS